MNNKGSITIGKDGDLVLVYLDNKFSNVFDVELMSNQLGLDLANTMEAFNSLMINYIIAWIYTKNQYIIVPFLFKIATLCNMSLFLYNKKRTFCSPFL